MSAVDRIAFVYAGQAEEAAHAAWLAGVPMSWLQADAPHPAPAHPR